MTAKILVADDSLTIQKVISITLKNLKYDIDEVLNESDLMLKIKQNKYDLILLDFNLSTARTGYDLIKQISSVSSGTPILVMLGTFDNANVNAIMEAGAAEKIVKPFDGHKFIEICKKLALDENSNSMEDANKKEKFELQSEDEESTTADMSEFKEMSNQESKKNIQEDEITKEFNINEHLNRITDKEEDDNDRWQVTNEQMTPLIMKNNQESSNSLLSLNTPNQLSKELEDWGISIPGVIGEKSTGPQSLPSKVEKSKIEIEDIGISLYPKSSELDFPDLEAHSRGQNDQVEIIAAKHSTPKLIPLSELAEDVEDNSNSRPLSLDIKTKPNVELENEILSEMQTEDIWHADEVLESDGRQMDNKTDEFVLNDVLQESPKVEKVAQVQNTKLDVNEELVEKLKASLAPVLEQFVKDYCRQTIEKIAWEVIPDLAENLIKKEIEEISKEI